MVNFTFDPTQLAALHKMARIDAKLFCIIVMALTTCSEEDVDSLWLTMVLELLCFNNLNIFVELIAIDCMTTW